MPVLSFSSAPVTADHAAELWAFVLLYLKGSGVTDGSRVITIHQPTRAADLKRAGVDGHGVDLSRPPPFASPSYLRYW